MKTQRQMQRAEWERGFWRARSPHLALLFLFYMLLWLEPVILDASLLADIKHRELNLGAESTLYSQFRGTRDLLWDMCQPLYERLADDPSDFYSMAVVVAILNALAWYLILPWLVLQQRV